MEIDHRAEFFRLFKNTKREVHRLDVWSDFVTTSAIALHNSVCFSQELEEEYLSIVIKYNKDEIQNICHMLSHVVALLEDEPKDILGSLYMELELGSENNGQYFTPDSVSQMMAKILHGEALDAKLKQPFITLQEPACGAGGMILAFVKVLIEKQCNPADKLWVCAIDINRIAALMCFIQLTLWNVPAEVLVGNALSMEMRERWCTPAHWLYSWESRLKTKRLVEHVNDFLNMDQEAEILNQSSSNAAPGISYHPKDVGEQIGFDFSIPAE